MNIGLSQLSSVQIYNVDTESLTTTVYTQSRPSTNRNG